MDKKVELTPEEAGRVSGGTGAAAECVAHSWGCYGQTAELGGICYLYKCTICGKTEYRDESGNPFHSGPTPVPIPDPIPVPDPRPVPLD